MSKLIKALFIVGFFLQVIPVSAQAVQNNQLTYIVQSGDTLNSIAFRLGVSAIDLSDANAIADPNQLAVGEILVVPGMTGISGTLTTQIVPLGQSLNSLSRQYQIPADFLVRLNHVTSPAEFYAGASLLMTQPVKGTTLEGYFSLTPGNTLLETSVLNGVSPWTVVDNNGLSGTWDTTTGENYYYKTAADSTSQPPLMPSITDISIDPLPIVQGKTVQITITTQAPMSLEGTLGNADLNFFQVKDNQYVALQGIDAMADPGLLSFSLKSKMPDGSSANFGQMILLKPGYFPKDPPLIVDPITIDPKVTVPEDALVASITKPVTPVKQWDGMFIYPIDKPICINAGFGDLRSYNGGPYDSFHTGVDFGVCANNLNIYAPAAGTVVYEGKLIVRGNATIIDHGEGVYSAIYHQKEFIVKVGDHVVPGQLLGIIGATGRVDGPHLHYEVWVNGVTVSPLDWLSQVFPALKP